MTAGAGEPPPGLRAQRYDVVVVGAGGAGSAAAARLSADPGRTVLLLEAGPVPRTVAGFPASLLDATRIPGADPAPGQHFRYPVRLTPGRSATVFRGRLLGGSTTTNGGYFVRARRDDFDSWAAAGNPAWAYQRVLPLLRALETDDDYGDSTVHGGDGPIPVRRPSLDGPAASAFAAAADSLDFAREVDKNDQEPPGFGAIPMNLAQRTTAAHDLPDTIRWNTGLAYVLPALHRPNLTVVDGCTVLRIRFLGTAAVGLQVMINGRHDDVDAGEIIMCAGAFETPLLLLRSGIGPQSDLRRLGIPVVCHLPGVGHRLDDHPQVVVEWVPNQDLPSAAGSWLAAGLNFRSTNGPPGGDLQILQSTVPMSVLTGHPAGPRAPLPLLVSAHRTTPGGSLRLATADPADPPRIDYGYLATANDRAAMREAVRTAVAVVNTPAYRAISAGARDLDRATVRDDAALDDWIGQRLGTTLHACGTAPMGPIDSPDAVVDQHGLVHHLTGLRIADTSILPTTPLRGPAATAVLIGEMAARAVTGAHHRDGGDQPCR
jgi:choline dehydrogenase